MTWKDRRGYVRLLIDGQERYQHRVVAERLLGRVLTAGESVHHRNGDKSDNSPGNLEVLSVAQHVRTHWEEGQYDQRVIAQMKPDQNCTRCGTWGKPHARQMCKPCYRRDYYERNPEKWARGRR